MSNRINNKEKQYAGGNWSANKFTKKHTEIDNPLIPEEPKIKGSKKYKKKKVKKPFTLEACPFCEHQLEKLQDQLQKGFFISFRDCIKGLCDNCGAKRITNGCPNCKRDIWLNKEGIYKHQSLFGCGFYGKKRNN